MRILALSEANILSFHSIALIAAAGENGISAQRIAELTNCSKNHLFKVLELLVKSNIIFSTRGPKGGYHMKASADEITLLIIFEVLNGKVDINDLCVGKNRDEKSFVFFQKMCHDLSLKYIDYLEKTKISDLIPKVKHLL